MEKPLARSRRHRIVAGVCGGIAESLGWNPILVRILFVVVSIFPLVPGILVYVVLWILLPKEPPVIPT